MAPKNKLPPIPDPYSVDYAPTGRATCKVGHDGFDIQYRHYHCGVNKGYVETLNQINGLFSLKWKDIEACAASYNIELDHSDLKVKEYRRFNEMLWDLKSQIESLPIKILKPILEANGMSVDSKMKVNEVTHIIGDGLLFGKLPNCPICEHPTLQQEGAEMKCWGYLEDSNVRCPFKYLFVDLLNPKRYVDNSATGIEDLKQLERKEIFILPSECLKIPIFKNWKLPKDAPSLRLQDTTITSKEKRGGSRVRGKNALISDDEFEDDVPIGWELSGMSFASVGGTTPSKQDLIELIVNHKGIFVENISQTTSYLLIGDDSKARATKRFSDSKILGVPVLHSDFILALLSRIAVFPNGDTEKKKRHASPAKSNTRKRRKGLGQIAPEEENENLEVEQPLNKKDIRPKGVILRQRKYAKYYLVSGKMPIEPFPKAKNMYGLNNLWTTPSIIARQDLKIKFEEEKIKKETVQEKQKIMRPPLKPGSALLRIDSWYHKNRSCRIYVDEYNNAYNCTTLLTDVTTGINKFYNVQLIEDRMDESCPRYTVFRKWGRVGSDGGSNYFGGNKTDSLNEDCGRDLQEATRSFRFRCFGLTGVDWEDRFDKKPVGGRYRYVHLQGHHEESESKENENNNSLSEGKVDDVKTELVNSPESTLSRPVKELIQLIFNKEMMEHALEEQDIDLAKMPLGSLSKAQITEGYTTLYKLQELLTERTTETVTMKWKARVMAATNRFYTTIPHYFKLNRTPPLIDNFILLKQKIEMMEQLLEINVANSIMDEALQNAKIVATLDGYYFGLKCVLKEIDKSSSTFQDIHSALKNTHGITHNTFTLSIMDIYAYSKESERNRYTNYLNYHPVENRRLLWHGSRLTNWAGILKLGLRIAPAEAPVSGSMFGKGIYFADMVSKSSQYCFADEKNPYGVLVLCEVALGKPYHRLEAQESAPKLCQKKGCQHTWGIGGSLPDPSCVTMIESPVSDTKVPLHTGKGISSKEIIEKIRSEEKLTGSSSLLYNEFIVYDEAQVLMRYVLRVKFEFKSFLDDIHRSSSSDTSSSSESHGD